MQVVSPARNNNVGLATKTGQNVAGPASGKLTGDTAVAKVLFFD